MLLPGRRRATRIGIRDYSTNRSCLSRTSPFNATIIFFDALESRQSCKIYPYLREWNTTSTKASEQAPCEGWATARQIAFPSNAKSHLRESVMHQLQVRRRRQGALARSATHNQLEYTDVSGMMERPRFEMRPCKAVSGQCERVEPL